MSGGNVLDPYGYTHAYTDGFVFVVCLLFRYVCVTKSTPSAGDYTLVVSVSNEADPPDSSSYDFAYKVYIFRISSANYELVYNILVRHQSR